MGTCRSRSSCRSSSSSKRQPCISPTLVVLMILAVGVQGTAGQLWDKLPILGRFSKAAQAAKAAAAAITAPNVGSPSTPSLPPATAAPVITFAQLQAQHGVSAPAPPAPASPAPPPANNKAGDGAAAGGKKGAGGSSKKMGTTGKNDTQAGCSCLSEWQMKPGSPRLSGCANPDNDPMGAWCPVDPNECLGYYSMYRTEKGKLRFFDYCVPVRERTKSGCLCSGDWNLGDGDAPAMGKSHYRDGCAQPQGTTGPRVCKVDAATCPPGVEVVEEEMQECVDKPQQASSTQDQSYHGCACVPGWSFTYMDGTSAIFSTCANPDADPLGAWCEVDPTKCESYATVLKPGNKRMSIDYCQSRFKNAPEPARCEAALRLYDQCGGKSNCTHSACLNAPWPGACCPKGTECKKQDAFFYQCLPIDHDMSVKGYKTPQGGSSSKSAAKGSVRASITSINSDELDTGGTEWVAEIASSSLEDARESSTPAKPKTRSGKDSSSRGSSASGTRVWIKLRLGMDYDLLMAQTQRLSEFKSDVAAWLREVAGDAKYVRATGVDEVLDGSVIAVSYVDYSKDAPLEAVDAAIEHMQDSAQTQYADSKLPAKWGWLLNYSIGQNKTALLEENPADVSIQALNFPAQSGEQARRKLSVTATIAVTITGLIVLLGVALLIYSFRNRRAASKQDLDAAGAKKAAKVEKAKLGGKKTSAVGTQGGGGGSGGTGGRSGYLHDLDGMLDDGSSAQDTKTISSGSSQQASSTIHRLGQGFKGALVSSRLRGGDAGSTRSSVAPKRPSESGTNRLWNWLQKAETPTATINARGDASSMMTSTDSRSMASGSNTKSTKDSPKSGTVMRAYPLAFLNMGEGFRVPPPSPRYTERAAGPSVGETAAAGAATTAAAAAYGAGSNVSNMLSPRPAPSSAMLNSGAAAAAAAGGSSGRAGPQLSRTSGGQARGSGLPPLPPSSSVDFHSTYAASATGTIHPQSYVLESMTSDYATASEFSTLTRDAAIAAAAAAAAGGGGGGGGGGGVNATIASASAVGGYGGIDSSAGLGEAGSGGSGGMLPPGVSMGPFLRAAIKSLTGQSLGGDSMYGSDGGEGLQTVAAPGSSFSDGLAGGLYSSSIAPPRSLSPARQAVVNSNNASYHSPEATLMSSHNSHQYSPRLQQPALSSGQQQQQQHIPGMPMHRTARMTAENGVDAEGDEPDISSSVFQSLWMQRLVAAAQANSDDDGLGGDYGGSPQHQQHHHHMHH